MLIALATSRDAAFAQDDAALDAAAARRGLPAVRVVWDDPSVDWARFDAVVIRTTWDYTARLPAFLAWIDQVSRATRLVNAAPVARWSCDKRYLRALEAEGVPVIPTRWSDLESLAPALAALADDDVAFLKPVVGATSEGTLKFRGVDRDAALQHALRSPVPMMLQPFLTSVATRGELSVIVVAGAPSHAVRKVPVPGDYRVQEDFGAEDLALPLDEAPVAEALAAMAAAARVCGVNPTFGRVDFLVDAAGRPCVNELELVEPCLFFRHDRTSADRLLDAVVAAIA